MMVVAKENTGELIPKAITKRDGRGVRKEPTTLNRRKIYKVIYFITDGGGL